MNKAVLRLLDVRRAGRSALSDWRFRLAAQHYWALACRFDGFDGDSKFAVFSKDNPYAALREWLYRVSLSDLAGKPGYADYIKFAL